ncbi:MAG: ABC transporter substrate-binding protein [Phycisphaerales bacterium]
MNPGEITRRAAVGGLAAAGLGFALFGPRGSRESAGRIDGRVVLDYWEKWTRHEGDAMREVVRRFNESQDRLHVRYVVTADIGQKSMVAIAGGAPPDLIGLYAFNVPGYAESGALHPLDELAPKFGVTLDQYAEGVRGVMTHEPPGVGVGVGVGVGTEVPTRRVGVHGDDSTRAVGVPGAPPRWFACVNTAGSVALYYSKAAFRDAGLDPERGPRTIAELDEFHARLIRRGRGGGGGGEGGALERVGFFHPEPGWWSWIWAYHFGGSIYDRRRDAALADSRENVAALEWMQRYSHELGVKECQAFKESFGNYFTPENPFLTGKVAMIVQGPWVANLMPAFAPGFEYGVCPMPGLEAGGPPIGHIDTDVIVIPRGARHPEASMEFIAWTQRQDMTELLATAHCKPSPLARASDEFLANHPNRGVQVHYDIFRSPRAFLAPRTRVWQQYKDEFDTHVQRLWRHEASPGEAMARMQARAQGFITRAADQRERRAD